ncbi:MAG: hypothetical protein RL514_4785 [Verrucomicrobiota bacterium]|jgi:hypothetical protein
MMRARFHASLNRWPASVPSNCNTRSSKSLTASSKAAASVSTSRSNALRFTISPRGAFITLLNADLVTGDAEFKALEKELKIHWLK